MDTDSRWRLKYEKGKREARNEPERARSRGGPSELNGSRQLSNNTRQGYGARQWNWQNRKPAMEAASYGGAAPACLPARSASQPASPPALARTPAPRPRAPGCGQRAPRRPRLPARPNSPSLANYWLHSPGLLSKLRVLFLSSVCFLPGSARCPDTET